MEDLEVTPQKSLDWDGLTNNETIDTVHSHGQYKDMHFCGCSIKLQFNQNYILASSAC